MSQAPRHSKPLTKNSPSGEFEPSCSASWWSQPVASQNSTQEVVGAAHPARDVVADEDAVLGGRLEPEEVVEARDRLEVGGGDAHDRGGLADAVGGAPAVVALDGPERRDRGGAKLRVAAHRLLDRLAGARAARPPRGARGRARRPRGASSRSARRARRWSGRSVGRIGPPLPVWPVICRCLPGSGRAWRGSGSGRRCTRRRTCRGAPGGSRTRGRGSGRAPASPSRRRG